MWKGENKTIYFCLRTRKWKGLSMNVRYSMVLRTHRQTLFRAKLFTFMVVKRKKLPASAAPSSFYILSRDECKDEGSILTEGFFSSTIWKHSLQFIYPNTSVTTTMCHLWIDAHAQLWMKSVSYACERRYRSSSTCNHNGLGNEPSPHHTNWHHSDLVYTY